MFTTRTAWEGDIDNYQGIVSMAREISPAHLKPFQETHSLDYKPNLQSDLQCEQFLQYVEKQT